ALHASDVEQLNASIMQLALERTSAHHGAILLWDEEAQALALDFHVVRGLVVTLPDELVPLRRGARYNGVAAYVFARNESYICDDAPTDPHYAAYYFDVLSIAAGPIRYQDRAIGVLSVSSTRPRAFDAGTIAALEDVATSSSLFLRRAQLYRAGQRGTERPFLIKGLCPEWLEVERRIERVANTRAPVLVHGESGTGKELVAHAIHFNSKRSKRPFVSVNCAAIPETLLESVLFGHVRGAFPGATADQRGEIVKADGGTLFLDELGELPVPLQAKVLRALEYGEVLPLGSNDAPVRVDVRLVCATNRDLKAMAARGEFREDLYYRLSVMTMELPPLRAYKEDNLEVLAHVFLKQAAERHEREIRKIAPETIARLLAYDFPGNVRELKNAIEHAVIMARGEQIVAEDLPRAILDASGAPPAAPPPSARPTLAEMRERWLAPLETTYLRELLAEHRGSVRAAAEHAGLSPVTMYRLLAKRGLGRARG
ncbi:MAG: sigma-54-dependent Fis family transcriptional regulator, partial [Sandaracinaceae bacterium]|nr:sigma-54-dependent Fis family transcriptional regulator [Sandaracinaceae bacterium]